MKTGEKTCEAVRQVVMAYGQECNALPCRSSSSPGSAIHKSNASASKASAVVLSDDDASMAENSDEGCQCSSEEGKDKERSAAAKLLAKSKALLTARSGPSSSSAKRAMTDSPVSMKSSDHEGLEVYMDRSRKGKDIS